MFKNWNTNDADLADFHGFWKIISDIVLFTN